MARTAPLTVLHKVIERVRAHEAALPPTRPTPGASCVPPRILRSPTRGSRLAVYDLRESVEALGSQTPVGMLSALQQVGDVSVLDAVADAWAGSTNAWFRGQLVTIFREIVAREKITKRHAADEEAGGAPARGVRRRCGDQAGSTAGRGGVGGPRLRGELSTPWRNRPSPSRDDR